VNIGPAALRENTPIVTRILVWSFVAAAVVLTLASTAVPGQDAAIAWYESLEAAIEAAQESDKLVMLSLHTEWCHWCHELEKQTWPDANVIEESKAFECVQVDPEKVDTDEKYDDGSYPRILFINAAGDIVYEIGGFAPPEAFIGEMKKANKGAVQLEEAKRLAAAFEADPQDYDAAFEAGHLYLEVGHTKDAIALLTPAYECIEMVAKKSQPETAFDYGAALLTDRQFEEAIEVFSGATDKYPKHERHWEGRFALGICYANLDKLVEARDEWKVVAASDKAGSYRDRAAELVGRVNEMLGDTGGDEGGEG